MINDRTKENIPKITEHEVVQDWVNRQLARVS